MIDRMARASLYCPTVKAKKKKDFFYYFSIHILKASGKLTPTFQSKSVKTGAWEQRRRRSSLESEATALTPQMQTEAMKT